MREALIQLLEWLLSILSAPPPLFGAPPRSPQWSAVRAKHLEKHSTCAACGCAQQLSVHHIQPFHLNPERELDQENLITLCEKPSRNCHFVLGHLLDWSAYNPSIESDAAEYRRKVRERLYS